MRWHTSLSVCLWCVLAAAAATWGAPAEGSSTIGPRDLTLEGDPVRVVLRPDGIPAILKPVFMTAAEADAVYLPDEPVLGVAVGGEARAYSLWLLDRHEIVNDTVGGRAIAATW